MIIETISSYLWSKNMGEIEHSFFDKHMITIVVSVCTFVVGFILGTIFSSDSE